MNAIRFTRNGKNVTISNERDRDLLLAEIIGEKTAAGLSLVDAWWRAERECPQLFAGMRHPQIRMPYKPKPPTFANAGDVPKFGSALKSIFLVGPGASQEVCEAAWRANANQGATMNYPAIFDGIVSLLSKQRGVDRMTAATSAQTEFPELWKMVQTIRAGLPATAS